MVDSFNKFNYIINHQNHATREQSIEGVAEGENRCIVAVKAELAVADYHQTYWLT